MGERNALYRIGLVAALAAAGLAGCDGQSADPPTGLRMAASVQPASKTDAERSPEVSAWLAGLRAATASFHDTASAQAAGWNARITDCMELPDSGAMGYHYANTTLIDGTPQEFAPELLVYAPTKNGDLRLVAVEYIVPYTAHSREAEPPSLHGVDFHHNDAFGLWVLHAWVWKHNPIDMFSDWNPDVSCRFAS